MVVVEGLLTVQEQVGREMGIIIIIYDPEEVREGV